MRLTLIIQAVKHAEEEKNKVREEKKRKAKEERARAAAEAEEAAAAEAAAATGRSTNTMPTLPCRQHLDPVVRIRSGMKRQRLR
jgi:hypothetical protein